MEKDSNRIRKFIKNKVMSQIDDLPTEVASSIVQEMNGWGILEWEKVGRTRVPHTSCNFRNLYKVVNSIRIVAANKSYDPDIQVLIPTLGKHSDIKKNIRRLLSISSPNFISIHVIFDGVSIDELIVAQISDELQASGYDFRVIVVPQRLGYRECLYLDFLIQSEGFPKYTIFMDDDAYITKKDHLAYLYKSLEQDASLEAVSGQAVDSMNGNVMHDFFNSVSDISMIQLGTTKSFSLDKPHIHGGGGVTMMRTVDFIRRLTQSLEKGYLFGPLVSGFSRKEGKTVKALVEFPVIHPTKNTFLGWLTTIQRYRTTWSRLIEEDSIPSQMYRQVYLPAFESFLSELDPITYQNYKVLQKFRRSFY